MSDRSNHVNVRFVCYDNQEGKFVYYIPLKNFTLKDIVNMFKRFSIVVGNNIDDVEIRANDWLNLE